MKSVILAGPVSIELKAVDGSTGAEAVDEDGAEEDAAAEASGEV